MKRIYSILILLCCTTSMVQIAAQSTRLSVRRDTAPSTRTTTPPKSTTTTPPRTTPSVARPAAPQNTNTVQPKARVRKETANKEQSGPQITIRAQNYNTQREIPSSLIWKRDIYRNLDLNKEENAGLGEPLTPTDDRMNLFTMIFKLLADRKLQAYEYTLDGNEQFDNAHKANFKDILDRFHVYYRRKRIAATNDTVFVVDNSDIPSNEVMSYYIKEVWYYDQNNSTFHTVVTALCPILHRSGDFDLNTVKYPMFWIKVSDLNPYMNQLSISTSPYNNAAFVNLDDFFSLRLYKGDIYKTNNPSGKAIMQYATTDSAVVKEQKLIQKQLESVEDNMWNSQNLPEDSIAITKKATTSQKATKVAEEKTTEVKAQTRRPPKEEKTKSVKSSSSSGGSAPKASVRRQRR